MPSSWPIVMTPVPPTPATTMPQGFSASGSAGSGGASTAARRGRSARVLLRALQLAAFDRDEARAEALQARVVLVAGVLVDAALAAELGLDRLDRQAVALHRAVAAAFADQLVDDDALGRVFHRAALAAAALLGRAGLVVDDDGAAGDLAQLALDVVELVAVVHGDARREPGARSSCSSYFSGSSVTTTILAAPSASSSRVISGTFIVPSTGWPPVIATASLNRIL